MKFNLADPLAGTGESRTFDHSPKEFHGHPFNHSRSFFKRECMIFSIFTVKTHSFLEFRESLKYLIHLFNLKVNQILVNRYSNMMHVVVTFNVKDSQRQFINSYFDNTAQVTYLVDFTEKKIFSILEEADILFTWNPPKELPAYDLSGLTKLKFVQVLSAGYDHIEFDRYPSGCKIASNKGAYAGPMAEHILAMVLALAKKLFINHEKMARGEFNQGETNISIRDSVFGILGYGGIGCAAARLIRPFGSKIYAINSSGKTNEEVDFIGTLNDLNFVLKNSNILIISLPLISETENLIGKRELELMKPDAILINVARAQIVNEEALYNHLQTHPDFFAGIDTWWIEPFSDGEFRVNHPFFDLPNVLGSPHNSPLVPGTMMEGIRRALDNINLFIKGKEPKHIVNQ